MTVLIDSSVWFAAMVATDKDNRRAKDILEGIDEPLTTDHVVIETWLLLNSRHGRYVAAAFAGLTRSSGLPIAFVTPADLGAAWQTMDAFPDQDFSLIDCTSFAVMERLGVHRVASFDHHFVVYRYGARRERAFDVLR